MDFVIELWRETYANFHISEQLFALQCRRTKDEQNPVALLEGIVEMYP